MRGGTKLRIRVRPRWWVEVGIVLTFYMVYSAVRNQFGSALGDAARQRALDNAHAVIDFQRSLGLFFEESIQAAFIKNDFVIVFFNVFYGTFHFIVTFGVLILLWFRRPERYVRWRSIMLGTTIAALVGFSLFPLMPPRLLSARGEYGGADPKFQFVDTLVDPGGLWSFDSGTMQDISNQYAAMPSLHIGWAFWSAIAVYPVLRRRSSKVVMVIYPVITFFAVIVTANHYWIDAVGGLVAFGAGMLIGPFIERILPKSHQAESIDNRHIEALELDSTADEHEHDPTASGAPR